MWPPAWRHSISNHRVNGTSAACKKVSSAAPTAVCNQSAKTNQRQTNPTRYHQPLSDEHTAPTAEWNSDELTENSFFSRVRVFRGSHQSNYNHTIEHDPTDGETFLCATARLVRRCWFKYRDRKRPETVKGVRNL
ncbi:hypothetical protein Pan241w_09240 [Gimesia alba]|uniref:Uncharacterized protein n=1 Tax=Gimesia alba TaxID=2527973 RepID=A0A517RAF7_9PLAN|nr:hypothetical protein Pan241w_09240 [Gimesia alba]